MTLFLQETKSIIDTVGSTELTTKNLLLYRLIIDQDTNPVIFL